MFEASIQKLWEAAGGEGDKRRHAAWERFLAIGLPGRRSELWRYVKLRGLYERGLEEAKRPSPRDPKERGASQLVFVNGFFQRELSSLPEGVSLHSLEEAASRFGAFFNDSWSRGLKRESDPFAALNGALHASGALIYLPPRLRLEAPVEILHLIEEGADSALIAPRLHIAAGEGAEGLFVCRTQGLTPFHLFNHYIDLQLERGAAIEFVQDQTRLGAASWHFEAVRAHLKEKSRLKTHLLSKGSATSRADYKISLAGEEAEASLAGLNLLQEAREAHVHVLVEHQAPRCRSNQLFKHALAGASHSSFEGKIYVHPEAQKTEAYQLNANLLLDEEVRAESKPNLEIFADDVKASHGATFGQLQEEHLFYLRARGLSEAKAKEFCMRGFCGEILDSLPEQAKVPPFEELL